MKIIAVIGGTGAMGGAVARQLLREGSEPYVLRLLTRDATSDAARAIANEFPGRVSFVEGNSSDRSILAELFAGAWGCFCNTDFWSSANVLTEYTQGVNALEVAKEEGVERFVYSSLDFCSMLSGGECPVPHFDGKGAVEAYIALHRSDEFMRQADNPFYTKAVSVLVTGPYFENFQSYSAPAVEKDDQGNETLVFQVPAGDQPYPMVAIDDIARIAQDMLEDEQRYGGKSVRIMGEHMTIDHVATTFTEVTGKKARYDDVPLDVVRSMGPMGFELVNFFRYVQQYGFERDYDGIREVRPEMMNFRDWLVATQWDGSEQQVQKGAPAREPEDR